MVNWAEDEGDWADDSAHTFVAGGVGVLSDMVVRATRVDGGALAILNTPTESRELVYITDELAEYIDELQFVVGEGPCLEAYRSGRPHTASDLRADHTLARWPAFAREASAAGADAVFAYPVGPCSAPVAVLELYRRTRGALGVQEHETALHYAEAIGTVLSAVWQGLSSHLGGSSADHVAQLSGWSPPSRGNVHVAAGMVAQQLGVSVGEAMDRVRAFTYASGDRLIKVSEDILAQRVSLAGGRDD